jgi:hypothetical protein
VRGKRYDAAGNAIGAEYPVADPVPGEQQRQPRICHLDGGGWAVLWHNTHVWGQDPPPRLREGVFARFLDEDGTPAGDAFRVSSDHPSDQGGTDLDIACLPGGGFFAAWGSSDQDGSFYGIFGQYIDGAGALVGAEVQVNTDTAGDQGNFGGVHVAASPAGKVLVLWSSNCPAWTGSAACPVEPDGSASSAQARLFDASGNPTGPEFRVNTTTLGSQGSHGLTAAFSDDESFIVVFASGDVDLAPCNDSSPCSDLLAQYYDANGAPVGGEVVVNSTLRGDQIHPDVASDGDGGYLVVWRHRPPYASNAIEALAGRHFGPGGVPSGSDFVVTSDPPNDDRDPTLASRGGSYVVAWTNFDRDQGWKRSVLARRLSGSLPVCPEVPNDDCANDEDSAILLRDGGTRPSKLTWKWSADTLAPDPAADLTGYSLCIYEGTGELVMSASAVPFASCKMGGCWSGKQGRYRFRSKGGDKFRVRALSLQNGAEVAKIRLKAAGMGAPMSRMHEMSVPLTAQLIASDGQCWQSGYGEVSMQAHSLSARSR